MANKHIRHGETYCGDGTTSAAATSNGGVGAWNNINILEGTTPPYGALAAGDVVYIRSKDNGGADISRTVNAENVTLGNAAGIAANPVTWILDGGTVWAGISGVLTYNCFTSYGVSLRNHNRFFADVYEAIAIVENSSNASYKGYGIGSNVWIKNVKYDFSVVTETTGVYLKYTNSVGYSVLENLHLRACCSAGASIMSISYGAVILINPDIELTKNMGSTGVIDASGTTRIECYGGQIRGPWATTGVWVCKIGGAANSYKFVGTQWPRTMTPISISSGDQNTAGNSFEAIGLDGGIGALLVDMWGSADSRTDNFYPTLNATLANSLNTPWSWKLYPQYAALVRPLRMTVAKMFTEAAATKTVTLELLIADTITLANLGTLWADIQYIDNATGLTKHVSTQVNAGGALTTSTAPWTATTYGAVNLLKRKISAATPTAIKQDTMVVVTLHGTFASASANDIMFLDPDVGMV